MKTIAALVLALTVGCGPVEDEEEGGKGDPQPSAPDAGPMKPGKKDGGPPPPPPVDATQPEVKRDTAPVAEPLPSSVPLCWNNDAAEQYTVGKCGVLNRDGLTWTWATKWGLPCGTCTVRKAGVVIEQQRGPCVYNGGSGDFPNPMLCSGGCGLCDQHPPR